MSKFEFDPTPGRREFLAGLAGLAMVGAGFAGIGASVAGIDDNWNLGVQEYEVPLDDPQYTDKRSAIREQIDALHEQQLVNTLSGLTFIVSGGAVARLRRKWR